MHTSYAYAYYTGCVWDGGGIPEADYIIIIIVASTRVATPSST